ncbi:hypothetical protein MNBD_GAMMA09-1914 [hydrothermal vent metagenome]|uniref:Uncharacterized protein n=1 Tax=hydrothermal vent metagenome TaxID=652676 RepID=A0A3B0YKQ9_9ZZZZ
MNKITTLHFIDADNKTCLHQLKIRNPGKPDNTAFISESEFNEITIKFKARVTNRYSMSHFMLTTPNSQYE